MLTPYFCIGEVLKPQGIRGEAKVRPYTDDPENFRRWTTLFRKDGENWTPIASRFSRVHDGFVYLTLEGCTKPEDVDKLRGLELYIDRANASPLPEGMFYLADLIGCEAVDEAGKNLGKLTDVLQHGPTDVYVFKASNSKTWMAPALPDAFPEKDVEHGIIRVNSERLKEVAVDAD
ncbi:MAG: 16S rRNA processing protein RimM [Clostridia bacterium]|nr:16S rRNA processing protein RimM [Clostridia bacterium]